MDSISLLDIANQSRVIRTTYERSATALRQAEQRLADIRADSLLWERLPDEAERKLFGLERDRNAALASCEEGAEWVNRLALLLPQMLPNLCPSLKLVEWECVLGRRWHERRDFDWAAAHTELRRIEAMAMTNCNHKAVYALLTDSEAAEILRLTPRQVARLAKLGELPSVQLPGDETRFDPDDLRQWVEAHKRPAVNGDIQ